jgi:hypothetical protein
MAVFESLFAFLRQTPVAIETCIAVGNDRPTNAIANREFIALQVALGRVCTHGNDLANNLMPQDARHWYRPPASNAMQIAPAKCAGQNLHQNFTTARSDQRNTF